MKIKQSVGQYQMVQQNQDLMKIILLYSLCMIAAHSALINPNQNISSIIVSGTGVAMGKPNIATLTATISKLKPTSKEAFDELKQEVQRAQQILANNGVRKSDISTLRMSSGPQYDYPNGTQTLKGQRASQTLSIKIRNVTTDGTAVAQVIAGLGVINGIEISEANFQIQNTKALQAEARSNAFINSKTKAEQYAKLAGIPLGPPLVIDETNSSSAQPLNSFSQNNLQQNLNLGGSGLPIGSTDVQVNVVTAWKLGAR